MPAIVKTQPVIGLEIHVELATSTKMFSRAPNPAGHPSFTPRGSEPGPNTCVDPVVLALPGALPVMNKAAVDLAITVGLALSCSIAPVSRWDRKSYFYPDLPKGYQISQYDLPLCFDGSFDLPVPLPQTAGAGGPVRFDSHAPATRIGIIRAHLEEDAGKLLHELPGGGAVDGSIADYNRAGTPLLEIVTQPDFTSADQVVLFCQQLRSLCRFLRATRGVMQEGHIRFEPNINTVLTLDDGRTVKTPIVEVKNLNSFSAVRGAIDFELAEQPARWQSDGRVLGPGTKQTRGWDDVNLRTVLQREKEDAHDYRYFPDPDLLPVPIDAATVEAARAALPELPLARLRRYRTEFDLGEKEAAALVEERDDNDFYEHAIDAAERAGVPRARAGKAVANILLQSAAKRANAQADAGGSPLVSTLGASAAHIGELAALRETGAINNQSVDLLLGLLCEPGTPAPAALAQAQGLMVVRDDSAIDAWCTTAIEQNAKAADDVRAGKDAALGRLVGAAMKAAAGKGDAATIRERLLKMLGRA